MTYPKLLTHSFLISLFSASLLTAQNVEFIFVEYTEDWIQSSPEQLDPFPYDPAPYNFYAGFEVAEGELSSLSFTVGDTVTGITQEDHEFQANFQSLEELIAAWPAGTYTFSGEGNEVGAFSFDVEVEAFTPLAPKRFTNYQELQSVNPEGDITIEWEAFTDYADEGLIMVSASYPMADGSYVYKVWESENTRDDGLPGLPADTTSVIIPAGTLIGGDIGLYDISVEFLSLNIQENTSPFDDALVVVLFSSSNFVQLVAGDPSETPVDPTPTEPVDPTPTPTPTEPVDELYLDVWAIQDNHWTETEGWLDWLWVGNRPWAFSLILNGYIHVDEDGFDPDQGGWFYVPRN